MKQFLLIGTFLFCCVWVYSQSQVRKVHFPIQGFMNRAERYIDRFEERLYIIRYVEFDKIVKDRTTKSPIYFWGDPNGEKEYTVFLIADRDRVTDIDMCIYKLEDDEWQEVKCSSSPGHEERLKFNPLQTGYYRIELKSYNFINSNTRGKYCIIIYQEEV